MDEKQLYKEAVELVIENKLASVSFLQRRLRLGYSQAARLIDRMEKDKVVSEYLGSTPRKVLATSVKWVD